MPTRCSIDETEHLTAEFWPAGLNAAPVAARVVSLGPGVLCLATETPPAPGARFVTKFSIRGEFPIVAGCHARWRLERAPGEYWVSATFLTIDDRDWEVLCAAWRRQFDVIERRVAMEPALALAAR